MNPPAATPRHTIVLEVAGQKLRLAANADPGHLERLAALINERVETVQRSTRTATASTLLALVALDVADELVSTRRKVEEAHAEARRLVAAAEARALDIEQSARRAVAEALAEIDRALEADDACAKTASESETA